MAPLITVLIPFGLGLFMLRRQGLALVLLILLNPLSFNFGAGIIDYLNGVPRWPFKSLPNFQLYNLEPRSRAIPVCWGDVVRGDEWVYIEPHNLAVGLMGELFGPAKGAYQGPYPSKEEAKQLLEREGTSISLVEFKALGVVLDGTAIKLEPNYLERIFDGSMYFDDTMLKLVVVRNEQGACLLMEVSGGYDDDQSSLLFWDLNVGRPFAYFDKTGGLQGRFHPVRWLEEDDAKMREFYR